MKERGFTLIELLAVIVILAIIALIATPIILDIISDARDESAERSAELYMSAVEIAVAKENMHGKFSPSICNIQTDGNLLCGTKTLTIEVNGEAPTAGTIMFESGKIASYSNIKFKKKYVSKSSSSSEVKIDTESKKVLANTCMPVTGASVTTGNEAKGAYAKGDEYVCEVKDGVLYNFFVISTNSDGTVNLIMDRNVGTDGTPATSDNLSQVAWISKADYDVKNAEEKASGTSDGVDEYSYTNNYCPSASNVMVEEGAITAINALKLYVSTWDNIKNYNYSMSVDPYMSSTPGVVVVPNPAAQSNALQTAIWTPYQLSQTMKARLMTVKEALENGCKPEINTTNEDGSVTKTNVDSCPRYLTNYLQHKEGYVQGQKVVDVKGIRGYWLLNGGACTGYLIHDNGSLNSKYTVVNNHSGIRPVITLSTSDLG